jgi:hypothetical protein
MNANNEAKDQKLAEAKKLIEGHRIPDSLAREILMEAGATSEQAGEYLRTEPEEEISELLRDAAFTAVMAGMSFDETFAIFVQEWESALEGAEIEKQLGKEWNAKPEAEKKRIEAELDRMAGIAANNGPKDCATTQQQPRP